MMRLHFEISGSGPPVVLLHGFPQTHAMWRKVTPLLAGHTVICPDLRGYGESPKPLDGYSKRELAADVVALARELGYARFALVGHDRGALVAFRAALDHPEVVTHLVCLDVLPTIDMWEVLHGVDAAVAWHLYLMAQPIAEALIAGAPEAFFGHFLDVWAANAPLELRDDYIEASRRAIPSIVADYRASATIDIEHDRADRDAGNTLAMPVTVLQNDWGFPAVERWRPWAPDLVHELVDCGHFMAEEAPELVAGAISRALRR
jgi:haloacetate dehalogenase